MPRMSYTRTAAYTILAAALGAVLIRRLRQPRRPVSETGTTESASRKSDKRVTVLFGSQTGTAESFAKELVEEGTLEFGLDCGEAVSVESLDLNDFFLPTGDKTIILTLSTYGEGDPSDDAMAMDAWLKELVKSDNSENVLSHIRFAIFGLGNKQYALFNEMAKRTERMLLRLGAVRICPTGLGDDNADIEEDFADWRATVLWRPLLSHLGLDYDHLKANKLVRNPADKIMLELKIAEKRGRLPFDATVHSTGNDVVSKLFFSASIVPVVGVTQLCVGKTQVDVDISKVPSLRYRTGDTLELLPLNRDEDVNWLLREYGMEDQGDWFVTFTKKSGVLKHTVKKPFPTPCTLRAALTKYVDLQSSPSRSFLRDIYLLMGHSADATDELVAGLKRREALLTPPSVFSVMSVLQTEFTNFAKRISFSDLIQLLPKQKARAYSIASSAVVDPKRISIVISRVDDQALASVFLCDRVQVNDTLSVSLRAGTFRLPALPGQPVIMIAVGTGVAPFRAFIAELAVKKRIAADKSVLFFGCRTEDEWIYRNEMEEFRSLGGQLHVALSRQIPGKVEYVQDLVVREREVLKELVNVKNAVVFVCGSTKMGLAVMDVFGSHIAPVSSLRTEKRYFEELWG